MCLSSNLVQLEFSRTGCWTTLAMCDDGLELKGNAMPSALPTLDYERTSNGTITSHMVADLNRCSIALKDRRTHFAKTIFADLLRTLRRTCNKVDIVSLVPVLQKILVVAGRKNVPAASVAAEAYLRLPFHKFDWWRHVHVDAIVLIIVAMVGYDNRHLFNQMADSLFRDATNDRWKADVGNAYRQLFSSVPGHFVSARQARHVRRKQTAATTACVWSRPIPGANWVVKSTFLEIDVPKSSRRRCSSCGPISMQAGGIQHLTKSQMLLDLVR